MFGYNGYFSIFFCPTYHRRGFKRGENALFRLSEIKNCIRNSLLCKFSFFLDLCNCYLSACLLMALLSPCSAWNILSPNGSPMRSSSYSCLDPLSRSIKNLIAKFLRLHIIILELMFLAQLKDFRLIPLFCTMRMTVIL